MPARSTAETLLRVAAAEGDDDGRHASRTLPRWPYPTTRRSPSGSRRSRPCSTSRARASTACARIDARRADPRRRRRRVAELVRSGRVRELAGIGGSIEARLRELVETGRLAELDELEASVRPELVGLARLVGLAPQRLVEVGNALGVSTADELREAAAAQTAARGPGIGPSTEAKILAALDRPRLEPRRGLTLNRALRAHRRDRRAPRRASPPATPRRWCDLSHQLAVVVGERRPARARSRGSQALPEIVSIAERDEHRALGVTVDGVPVELVVAPPHELGTALVRATGSAGVRRRARRAAARGRRAGRLRRARRAVPAARAARGAVRRAGTAAPSSGPRSAATCTCTPRGRTARASVLEMARGGDRARLRVPRDLRPHARACASCPGSTPTTSAGRARRSPPRTSGSRRSASFAASSATSSPTARSISPTTSSPSSTGCRRPSMPASARSREQLDAPDARRDRAPCGAFDQPSARADPEPPARRTPSTSTPSTTRAPRPGTALETNGLPDRIDLSATPRA